jgi:hypothetical protein
MVVGENRVGSRYRVAAIKVATIYRRKKDHTCAASRNTESLSQVSLIEPNRRRTIELPS